MLKMAQYPLNYYPAKIQLQMIHLTNFYENESNGQDNIFASKKELHNDQLSEHRRNLKRSKIVGSGHMDTTVQGEEISLTVDI
jgi:hypothetical protein